MQEPSPQEALAALDAFVGTWSMTSSFAPDPADAPLAETTFEWMPGHRFLIQRWEVGHPAAPDGIAIIGFDADRATLLQHYFDERGVARVYDITFDCRLWTLQRIASAPDFSQRFTGTFADDGDTIVGRWDTSHDSSTWERDFDLTYTRVR
jgi:hypothetical protein